MTRWRPSSNRHIGRSWRARHRTLRSWLSLFARVGDSTRVEVTSEIRLRGAMRILGPVVTLVYGRAWARGLVYLKELMESGRL